MWWVHVMIVGRVFDVISTMIVKVRNMLNYGLMDSHRLKIVTVLVIDVFMIRVPGSSVTIEVQVVQRRNFMVRVTRTVHIMVLIMIILVLIVIIMISAVDIMRCVMSAVSISMVIVVACPIIDWIIMMIGIVITVTTIVVVCVVTVLVIIIMMVIVVVVLVLGVARLLILDMTPCDWVAIMAINKDIFMNNLLMIVPGR